MMTVALVASLTVISGAAVLPATIPCCMMLRRDDVGLCAAVVDYLYECEACKFVVYILALRFSRYERCLYHAVGGDGVHTEFLHISLYRSGIAYVEVQASGLRCGESHYCHIVVKRTEYLAGVGDTVGHI